MIASGKFWLQDLLLLTLLIGILFGAFLGNRSLAVPDEARYSEIPREMLVTGDYVTPHLNYIKYFEKPPLFYWLQAGAIKIFGLQEWSLRLVTMVMGLLGCLITYSAARKLYDRRTGWIASLILATSILYFFMARFITVDMTLSTLLSASLFCFILGTRAPPGMQRNIFMWLMYGFSALATLTKGLIGIIFPGAIIFVWILIFNDWRPSANLFRAKNFYQAMKTYCLPSGLLLWLLITLPWHILVQSRNPEFFHFYIIEQHVARYFTHYANRDQPLWYLPGFLILGFFPWITFLPQVIHFNWPRSWRARSKYKIEIFLLLWAVIIYLIFQLSHSQLPPYLLPIFPPLAVLTAKYFSINWDQTNSKGIWAALITLGILLLLTVAIASVAIYFLDIIPNHLITHYLSISGILFLLTGIIAILSYRSDSFKATFVSLVMGMSLFLISLNLNNSLLEQKSIKPLIMTLKSQITSNDQVLSYHGYYQDLPFYLQRRIIFVAWSNKELEFGMQHQDMNRWFIDDKTLWKQWNDSTRLFLFMSHQDYNKLISGPHKPLHLIAQTARDVLLSNRV